LFGLDQLTKWLDTAVTSSSSSTSDQLAGSLYTGVFVNWFQTYGFPLLIGVATFFVVLYIFYGAFLYFTAYGDENRAMQAKKTLTYAFVGLVIVLVAFAIASFVQRLLIEDKIKSLQAPAGVPQVNDPRQIEGIKPD